MVPPELLVKFLSVLTLIILIDLETDVQPNWQKFLAFLEGA
jgi:hypothetical protein